ncbi:hypothetical protein [Chengkuizengella marina]|uniref:hypothetical protein n=1 Tax=Chengkuizengella marina TaxID=2507566 RepID=UPI00191C07A4|nr:hypothetical protein [Chengkuizengella marina]
MKWIYCVKLYDSKFQAGCLAKRMEEDWWVYGFEYPTEVEVFKSQKGRYGVRYII